MALQPLSDIVQELAFEVDEHRATRRNNTQYIQTVGKVYRVMLLHWRTRTWVHASGMVSSWLSHDSLEEERTRLI